MDDTKNPTSDPSAEAAFASDAESPPAAADEEMRQAAEQETSSPATAKRWLRHPSRRVFGGVCGGLADYFGSSEGLIRLLFLVSVLFFGVTLPLYLLFWLFLPVGTKEEGKTAEATICLRAKHGRWFAYGLIGLGGVLLASNLGLFGLLFGAASVLANLAPSALIILVGVLILRRFHRRSLTRDFQDVKASSRKVGAATAQWSEKLRSASPGLHRSRQDKVFAGVCGGLGRRLSVDPLLIRLAFVLLSFAPPFFMIPLYLVLAVILPREPAAEIKPAVDNHVPVPTA